MSNITDKVKEYGAHYGDIAFIVGTGLLKEPINAVLSVISPELAMDINSSDVVNRGLEYFVRLGIPTALGVAYEISNTYNEDDNIAESLRGGLFSSFARIARNLLTFYFPEIEKPFQEEAGHLIVLGLIELTRYKSPIAELLSREREA